MSGAESLLCEILSCGTADLEMLDGFSLNWGEVLDQIDWPQYGLGFNDIMRGVFACGIIRIENEIDCRICDLERSCSGEEEEEELAALKLLNPNEDITAYFNCLDTYVYFRQNGEIYRRYLEYELNNFYDNTGFEIEGE